MPDLSPRQLAAIFGALALVVSMTAGFEGKRNVPYKDVGGVPTDCYGHTGNVGRTKTDQECAAQLAHDELDHGIAIDACLPIDTPLQTRAAFIDFAYNVGTSAFCHSTAAKKAQAGDFRGACAELSKWVYAGGQQLPGLVKRRAAERALCEQGLAPAAADTPYALGYNSQWSDARPPVRFQKMAQMILHTYPKVLVEDECVDHMNAGRPPLGLTIQACAAGPFVFMPNPCEYEGDAYADLLCHEQGHVNGWSGNHEP